MLTFNLSEKLIFESGMTISEIAKKIDMPKGQLSSYLSSEGKKTVDIMYGIRLVRMVCPEYEKEYMKAICPGMHRPQNLRSGLEYASTFMYFDLMEEMIKVNQKGNRENRDWADVYSIYLDFQEKKQTIHELKDRLNGYQPKFLETEIFYGIFMCSIFYVEKRYEEMYKWSKKLYKQVGYVKNDFIRESYMSRICDLIARSYLFYKNDTKKASFFAQTLYENEFSANRKYHAYYILALCHFFSDYDKSHHYFNLYHDSMLKIGNVSLANGVKERDITFLQNVWDVTEEAPVDIVEAAHYYAKKGSTELCLNILDNLETLTPFQKYYKALALGDPKLLSESFVDFLTGGNKFFANLPLIELKKYKTYDFFAELLYNKIGS